MCHAYVVVVFVVVVVVDVVVVVVVVVFVAIIFVFVVALCCYAIALHLYGDVINYHEKLCNAIASKNVIRMVLSCFITQLRYIYIFNHTTYEFPSVKI